jgi:hypothetical protein
VSTLFSTDRVTHHLNDKTCISNRQNTCWAGGLPQFETSSTLHDTCSLSSLLAAYEVHFFFFNRHYNPSWVLACSTVVENSQQEGFYTVPLPAARQTPNLEENQGFRAFQLSPQEAPSVWSDVNEPSSGRWNFGREMAEKFSRKWRLPRHFWVLLHAVKHDMGQTALSSPPKEGVLRIFSPEKSDGFGRVWNRELGYQRPARYL